MRAANTAVQALIAEISPWILDIVIRPMRTDTGHETLRWIAGAEVCPSTYNFVTGVVHDDGTISSERTRSTLLEESLVGLMSISLNGMGI